MTVNGRQISFDHATTPGLNPLQTIALAHELECDAVSLRLNAHPAYQDNPYDLIGDASWRRRVSDDIAERGMFVAVASGFEINAGRSIADLQPALEAAAAIGARGLSVVVYEKERAGHVERVGDLAERSAKLGVRTLIEFFALSGVDSLGYALDLIKEIGNPGLGLSADSLHFTRTGTTLPELAAVPAGVIGHGQVNDGPLHMPEDKQLDEARGNRLLPGEGEFDLVGFVRALPADVPIGVEAGARSKFARGLSMEEHGRAAIAATRQLIAKAFEDYR